MAVPKFEEQVASILGADLGIDISDETINLPIYAGDAKSFLKKIFPNYEDIPDSDPLKLFVDLALIYATVINLIPYWKQRYLKIEHTPAEKIERFPTDWNAFEEDLQAKLDNALALLVPEYYVEPFIGFRVNRHGCYRWRCLCKHI